MIEHVWLLQSLVGLFVLAAGGVGTLFLLARRSSSIIDADRRPPRDGTESRHGDG